MRPSPATTTAMEQLIWVYSGIHPDSGQSEVSPEHISEAEATSPNRVTTMAMGPLISASSGTHQVSGQSKELQEPTSEVPRTHQLPVTTMTTPQKILVYSVVLLDYGRLEM